MRLEALPIPHESPTHSPKVRRDTRPTDSDVGPMMTMFRIPNLTYLTVRMIHAEFPQACRRIRREERSRRTRLISGTLSPCHRNHGNAKATNPVLSGDMSIRFSLVTGADVIR